MFIIAQGSLIMPQAVARFSAEFVNISDMHTCNIALEFFVMFD